MKTTFDEFITLAPTCKRFKDCKEAKYIFENILSKDENIIKMIDLSEFKKPAICACVNEIDDYFKKQTNPEFDLNDNFTKQALGIMVKIVLNQFGYKPRKSFGQRDIPRAYKSKYIKTGTVYELSGTPKMEVYKAIREVK